MRWVKFMVSKLFCIKTLKITSSAPSSHSFSAFFRFRKSTIPFRQCCGSGMVLFQIRIMLQFLRVPDPDPHPDLDPTLYLIFEIVKKTYLIIKVNQEEESINWYH